MLLLFHNTCALCALIFHAILKLHKKTGYVKFMLININDVSIQQCHWTSHTDGTVTPHLWWLLCLRLSLSFLGHTWTFGRGILKACYYLRIQQQANKKNSCLIKIRFWSILLKITILRFTTHLRLSFLTLVYCQICEHK